MSDKALREHLLYLLGGGGAHLSFEDAIADLPFEYLGRKVSGVSHTVWRLVEHMRICQWDILEFSQNPSHVSPDFPEGYWPADDQPTSPAEWEQSLRRFHEDLQCMMDLVDDPSTDLLARIPHGNGQTILREALLVADHNAYHLGQLVFLRRGLAIWHD